MLCERNDSYKVEILFPLQLAHINGITLDKKKLNEVKLFISSFSKLCNAFNLKISKKLVFFDTFSNKIEVQWLILRTWEQKLKNWPLLSFSPFFWKVSVLVCQVITQKVKFYFLSCQTRSVFQKYSPG